MKVKDIMTRAPRRSRRQMVARTALTVIGTVIRKAGHITIDKATLTRQPAGADMLPQLLEARTVIARGCGESLRA